MYLENFNGINIHRPQIAHEIALRMEAEAHVRSKYVVGKYVDSHTINAILQHLFQFYSARLTELLPPNASIQLLMFVLFQYDQSSGIEELFKRGDLPGELNNRWAQLAPHYRRALKYLAERIVLIGPDEEADISSGALLESLDKVLNCVEELTILYSLSDQTISVVPKGTTLEILPPGEEIYYSLELTNTKPTEVQERTQIDTANRDRFVPAISPIIDIDMHQSFLDGAFLNTLGVSYEDAMSIVLHVIEGAEPDLAGPPVPFVKRSTVIETIASQLGVPHQAVDKVVRGFSISKANMESEGRAIWKPKQEYRAYRRGFFVVPHASGNPDFSGDHLVFSREMARECMLLLIRGLAFRQIPSEWQSIAVSRAADSLGGAVGKWFEAHVQQLLNTVGFIGVKSVKDGIGQGAKRINIPSQVGEIDYLGYSASEHLLLIGECKMTLEGGEAKYHRTTLHNFVYSKNAYVIKFRRKIQWMQENIRQVCEALASVQTFEAPIEPLRIATVMLTFYPSIATYFIDDLPCRSITELMMGYERLARWPYETGVFGVPSGDS